MSTMSALAAALGPPLSDKLTRENSLFWKMPVQPALRGAQVMEFMEGSDVAPPKTMEIEDAERKKETVTNPDYVECVVNTQQVLRYLLQSLSTDVLAKTVGLDHAAEVWAAIGALFAAPLSACITMLHGALSNTKKHDMTANC
jgi:hypothetical protein